MEGEFQPTFPQVALWVLGYYKRQETLCSLPNSLGKET